MISNYFLIIGLYLYCRQYPKFLKKVILIQHTDYLNNNNILHKNQYGFRKHHSTELASLHLVDKIYYKMDANEIPVNVDIDLSKAFDSLDHNILLSKLKFYGVTGVSLDLMSSYQSYLIEDSVLNLILHYPIF